MRRAVLMVVDGLRADLVSQETTPRLAAAGERAVTFIAHRSVFPSATRVNSASIATGCHPARHGLAGNAIAIDEGNGLEAVSVGPATFRERWREATGGTLRVPTLAERLAPGGGVAIYTNSSAGAAHMQDPDGHGHLYHRSGSHAPGLAPITGRDHLDVGYDAAGDVETTRRLCEALANGAGPERLHTLWICEPDHSQHALELGSPEHHAVLAGADACVGRVSDAVQKLRDAGDEVLFVICSDHGHETTRAVVPVLEHLVSAGHKDAPESREVVYASSGMGALIYLAPEALSRRDAIARWLERQPWCGPVYAGAALAQCGLPHDTALAIAFGMAKSDEPNRFGVSGLGDVAGDVFSPGDGVGLGQHGGLGAYETRPFLIVDGASGAARIDAPSSNVDIAPTIAEFLGESWSGMDGNPLAWRDGN